MKTSWKLLAFGALALLLITAASVQPQLSLDEQSAIVEAVVQTLNPEIMKKTLIAEVEADLIEKFNASGYVGLSAALMVPGSETEEEQIPPTATPTPEMLVSAQTQETISGTESPAATEDPTDYWHGAVEQEDGSFRGMHMKMVNSYAYTIGEDEDGQVRQFHTEYTPNTRFNLDVVFENDGTLVWPVHLEMRHVGNVGEYTGHAESVYIDRSDNPVKPGDRAGFTVSAYGSENLGWTTFYFQVFDAETGLPMEGGQGSFSYLAY